MPQALKRLILRFIDYAIRVVLHRLEVIRKETQTRVLEATAASNPVQAASEAIASGIEGNLATGWRLARVRPFVYPAASQTQAAADSHPRYFLVTSQGLAASAWLASSLNLHPEITCSMGIDHPLVSMRYYYNDDEIQRKIEGIRSFSDIRHGFYSETLRKQFKEKFAQLGVRLDTDLVRTNPVRQLQHMYDEIEWFEPRSKYYGNVHSCFSYQALEYLKEFPARRDVTLVNLIRHPVPRTEAAIKGILSVATHYQDSDWHKGITEGIDEFTETHSDMRREIEKRFGVDFGDVRNRGVLYSYYRALHNDCWAGEITAVKEACNVPIERLMSDRDYYSWFVWELTQREVTATPQYLDRIFNDAHLQSGRHMGKGRSPGPRQHYEAWTDWEKHEFKQAMQRLNLPDVYAPFGYDLSFVI